MTDWWFKPGDRFVDINGCAGVIREVDTNLVSATYDGSMVSYIWHPVQFSKEREFVEAFIPADLKPNEGTFITKDSGARQDYPSGMRRDVQDGKPRYDLLDLDFLKRWAQLMERGAQKYGARNWELANTQEELDRFKASALRHMFQWLSGETDEDHAAAVAFNLAAAEKLKKKLGD